MAEQSLIHFPLYIGDYLKDTITYTQGERAAYIDLCVAYIHNNGALTDDERIFIFTRCFSAQERTNVATVVERAFERKNGKIYHDGLESLLVKQHRLLNQRKEAGKKSAESRAQKQRALQQSESESESELDNRIKDKKGIEAHAPEPAKKKKIFLQNNPQCAADEMPDEFLEVATNGHGFTTAEAWQTWEAFWDYFTSGDAKVPKKVSWKAAWGRWCRQEKPNIVKLRNQKEREREWQRD